jgi:hypothetical protein
MSANAINATLFDNLRFSFTRDTAPVALVAAFPGHGGASIDSGENGARVHRLRQGQSGKINMASAGNATPLHVAENCSR